MQNIVLIGMPGCGKTKIAEELGKRTGREVIDSDDEITRRTGLSPSKIITEQGEKKFREIESDVLFDICKESGKIISTGGGVVTKKENYDFLHQNGIIVLVKRDLKLLSTVDRPLSQKNSIEELYAKRRPMYEQFADLEVENNSSVENSVNKIIKITE